MAEEPGLDRNLAFAALLAVLTAFWLPFWVVRLEDGAGTTTTAMRVFQPFDPVTTAWAPIVSGILLAMVALALVVRLAARSWYHEPSAWMASLMGSGVATGIVVLSLLVWPSSIPSAWGQRSLRDADGTLIATETAMPGLAWFLALLATALLGAAWWIARTRERAPLHTSDK